MKYKITYGVVGGINSEIVECVNLVDAEDLAYTAAIDIFESYGIFEEFEGCHQDIESAWYDEVDRWCLYSAEEIK